MNLARLDTFFNICRSSHRRYSIKKVLIKISQNSQENTYAKVSFLIKLQTTPATLLKTRQWHRRFPANFAKFVRATFFTEHLWTTASLFVTTYSIHKDSHKICIISSGKFSWPGQNLCRGWYRLLFLISLYQIWVH